MVCYYAAAPLVRAVGGELEAWIDPLAFAVGILLAAALLVSLAVFMASDSMRTISFVRHQSGFGEPKPPDPRELRCARLAVAVGLTQREQDVLYYLSMGHNAKKVAETRRASVKPGLRTHHGRPAHSSIARNPPSTSTFSIKLSPPTWRSTQTVGGLKKWLRRFAL